MHAVAQHLMIRGLIDRKGGAGTFVLTDQERAVLGEMLATEALLTHG